MTVPVWLASIATLDDDALAALANRGLLRRAAKLADAVTLAAADETSVELVCEQFRVRLLPAGPDAARCPCPAAGACVHVVAAWLWTRTVEIAAPEAGEAAPSTLEAAAAAPSIPESVRPSDGAASFVSTPVQRRAASEVGEVVERLVAAGLSQLGPGAIDRLTRAGQRARLEKLPLLARLVDAASGHLRALAGRDDEAGESTCLSALAQAWALAGRLADDATTVPAALLGAPSRTRADVGALMPLGVRWWTSASRARGLTFHAFDLEHGRLEEATTGRAAGADPGFQASWDAPLLWGASPAALSSGVVRLSGAERRDDGTLSPTTRARAEVQPWGDLDLDALAAAVNGASGGLARAAFGATPERLRLIRPRAQFGLGRIELDEVGQQLVWALTDADGTSVRLALPATELNVRVLTWLVEQSKLLAVTVIGDRPEAVFLPAAAMRPPGRLRDLGRPATDASGVVLVSLSLSRLPLRTIGPSWRRRILGLDRHRRAEVPLRVPTEVERLAAGCADVVEALAASGRLDPSPRQSAALAQRATQAADLGLSTLATALRRLATPGVAPADVLWARFVLDRVEALLA